MNAATAREIAEQATQRKSRTTLEEIIEDIQSAAQSGQRCLDVGKLPPKVRKALMDLGYRCPVSMSRDYDCYETTVYW